MEKVGTEKFQRERKFFTIAPVLVLPFLTGIFWSLGGGEGKRHELDQTETTVGINTSIPEVMEKSEGDLDKLAFYNQARKDSLEYLNRIKNDPYYQVDDGDGFGEELLPYSRGEFGYSPYGGGAYNDPQEEEVMNKLRQLQLSLAQNENSSGDLHHPVATSPASTGGANSEDIDRLENLMTTIQDDGGGGDPEMEQISGMLESILDIQHPDRVHERLMRESEAKRGQVFAVSAATKENIISILEDEKQVDSTARSGFYGIAEGVVEAESTAIAAVVHETQTVTNGSTVKLRLLSDIYIAGHRIPATSFIYGLAQLNGERIVISIPGIQHHNSVFPVKLSVFDLDGLAGIHVPGAIARDVAKESGDRTLQSLGLATFDPSLKAQAVSAGIEAGKSFLSRKVKLVKVTLKAGYKVLLVDGNKRND